MLPFSTDLSQHRILVVDDEPDNLEVLNTTLSVLHNAEVRVAASHEEALAQLATFHPTLIITDLSMPNADGYQLLKTLRERPDTAGRPVIALTAHVMNGDKDRVLSAGFDGYVGKPFDVLTLGETLEGFLKEFAVRHQDKMKENRVNLNWVR